MNHKLVLHDLTEHLEDISTISNDLAKNIKKTKSHKVSELGLASIKQGLKDIEALIAYYESL